MQLKINAILQYLSTLKESTYYRRIFNDYCIRFISVCDVHKQSVVFVPFKTSQRVGKRVIVINNNIWIVLSYSIYIVKPSWN